MTDGPRTQPRESFDGAAELYDAARPDYPAELIDDLIELADLQPGADLLEIGCGTGQATRALARRGFRIVAVELGENLARVAQRSLAGFPEVRVMNAAFEEWDPGEARFDLVFAATAWHWLDPAVRYQTVATALRPGGALAFWSALHAFPDGFDPFFTEIQQVYDEIGESYEGPWPPPPPEDVADESSEIEASGLFEDVRVRRYVWERSYTSEQYLALLDTFSGHRLMQLAARDHLYEQIRTRIAQRPDRRVRRHWYSILHVARLRGDL